jgi:hypothetical protein
VFIALVLVGYFSVLGRFFHHITVYGMEVYKCTVYGNVYMVVYHTW